MRWRWIEISPTAHSIIGLGKIFIGRAEETEAHISEALRLSPRDTMAYSLDDYSGHREEPPRPLGASGRRGFDGRSRPTEISRIPHFVLAAALAQLGRLDEARSAVRAGLALNPSFTISRARANWTAMSDDPTYLAQNERFYEGMRKAGVPEQ